MGPIFHVGYPKTATRWLQESLFPCIKDAMIVSKEDIFEYIIKPDSLSFNPDSVPICCWRSPGMECQGDG